METCIPVLPKVRLGISPFGSYFLCFLLGMTEHPAKGSVAEAEPMPFRKDLRFITPPYY